MNRFLTHLGDEIRKAFVESPNSATLGEMQPPCRGLSSGPSPAKQVEPAMSLEPDREPATESDTGTVDVPGSLQNMSPIRDTPIPGKSALDVVMSRLDEIAGKVDALDAVMTTPSTKDVAGDSLSRTVELQMDLIRDSSRRVQELEDKAVFENVVRPMIEGLMLLHDGILARLRKLGSEAPQVLSDALASIDTEVMESLARYGVKPMLCDNAVFDPKRQKVVSILSERPLHDNEVVDIARDGFEMDGRIVRHQEVVIRKVKQEERR